MIKCMRLRSWQTRKARISSINNWICTSKTTFLWKSKLIHFSTIRLWRSLICQWEKLMRQEKLISTRKMCRIHSLCLIAPRSKSLLSEKKFQPSLTIVAALTIQRKPGAVWTTRMSKKSISWSSSAPVRYLISQTRLASFQAQTRKLIC